MRMNKQRRTDAPLVEVARGIFIETSYAQQLIKPPFVGKSDSETILTPVLAVFVGTPYEDLGHVEMIMAGLFMFPLRLLSGRDRTGHDH
jgi:hypothetical protein